MASHQRRRPWNKGKIVGPKPALTADQVKAIRTVLELKASLRDQVLFSMAIDSSLRGRDLVRLEVSDVASDGEPRNLIRVRPSKTEKRSRQTVAFEPAPYTLDLLRRHLGDLNATDNTPIFQRQRGGDGTPRPISERAYLDLVKDWVSAIGLPPALYGTHSLRRSRPAHLYAKTGNLRACQVMLGHSDISSTQRYLGVEEAETLAIARIHAL